jgi:hypothetical protein
MVAEKFAAAVILQVTTALAVSTLRVLGKKQLILKHYQSEKNKHRSVPAFSNLGLWKGIQTHTQTVGCMFSIAQHLCCSFLCVCLCVVCVWFARAIEHPGVFVKSMVVFAGAVRSVLIMDASETHSLGCHNPMLAPLWKWTSLHSQCRPQCLAVASVLFCGRVFYSGELRGRGLEAGGPTQDSSSSAASQGGVCLYIKSEPFASCAVLTIVYALCIRSFVFTAFQVAAIPFIPQSRAEIRAVSCGHRHTALLTTTGELLTFGWGECGRLGHGDERERYAFRDVLVY